MYTGLIAKRYAGALLEFACSNGEAEKVYAQAGELVKHFSSDKHIKAEIASPVIPSRMKQELICRGVNGICRSLEGLVALVIKQGREQFLLFMLHSFIQLYQQRNGIADVLLTTAAPIGKSIEGEVGELVRKNVARTSQNALPNGVIVLKGGDLENELAPFKKTAMTWDLRDSFNDEFFDTKKVVYVQC